MLLVLDIGNSNITLGVVRAGALSATRRTATPDRATTDDVEVLIGGLLALDDLAMADISAIACASVVPRLTATIEAIAGRREQALTLASAGTVPMPIRVDRPADVGADRLVNALAAARLHGTPALVMDLGTATTLEGVAADGAFVGGAIAPGLGLGLDALVAGTALLPRVELRAPDRVIARDTVSAIQAGSVLGYQALASGLLSRARRELADLSFVEPGDVTTILTGGLSTAPWAGGIEGVDVVDPDLTLRGLAILHADVRGGERLELGLP